MAGETTITVIGNLTGDPELRFTPSGAAVANFTVASTPRTFDRQSNEWKDGETLFMRCSVWREVAENVAESLHRGTRVIVSGRLKSRSYETKEGEKRTVIEMDVDEVGPSLRYATTKVNRTQRSGGGNLGGGGGQQEDPWAGGGNTGGQGGSSGGGWGSNSGGGSGGQSAGGNSGGWVSPSGGNSGNSGGGNSGGNSGGWGNAPSYDEPPF
ncbi:single-stranded DNA-binding protein [Nostocoides vanveenii]|uniref:Single-stranded DNA-binding protein n=1 Tax=Nostocoides vanveenii TaxID=330835 RepID=A0ABN2L4W1_9MICO